MHINLYGKYLKSHKSFSLMKNIKDHRNILSLFKLKDNFSIITRMNREIVSYIGNYSMYLAITILAPAGIFFEGVIEVHKGMA